MKKARLVRVLVYEGSPEWVSQCLQNRGIKGSFNTAGGIIKEAIVGDFLEILDEPASTVEEPTI